MAPPDDSRPFQRTGGYWAEENAAALQAELVGLRIAERAAAELAEYATGEASELRKRLDAAEQKTSEERARADRERERANRAEAQAERASARVQELTQAMAEKAAPPPEPEPPRSRWERFKAWRRWPHAVLASAVVLSAASAASAEQLPFMMLSNGQDSCGEFLAGDHERQMIDIEWILGFISGVNFMSAPGERAAGKNLPHTDALRAWVQNYCGSRAFELIPTVALALRAELIRRQGGVQ
jgi:hypothetical protein